MLPVCLGGEQIGRVDATGGYLGEELLDQRIDSTGVEYQPHGAVNPVTQEGDSAGQQSLAADLPHQTQFHQQLTKQG